jgi:hypothetical protein
MWIPCIIWILICCCRKRHTIVAPLAVTKPEKEISLEEIKHVTSFVSSEDDEPQPPQNI